MHTSPASQTLIWLSVSPIIPTHPESKGSAGRKPEFNLATDNPKMKFLFCSFLHPLVPRAAWPISIPLPRELCALPRRGAQMVPKSPRNPMLGVSIADRLEAMRIASETRHRGGNRLYPRVFWRGHRGRGAADMTPNHPRILGCHPCGPIAAPAGNPAFPRKQHLTVNYTRARIWRFSGVPLLWRVRTDSSGWGFRGSYLFPSLAAVLRDRCRMRRAAAALA